MPAQLGRSRRNPRMSSLTAAIKRHLNRLFVRDALNPGAPFAFTRANRVLRRGFHKIDRRLPDAIKAPLDARTSRRVAEAVGVRYRASNRRTAELCGIDLEQYGYDV